MIFPFKLCAKTIRYWVKIKWCCTEGWIVICIPCGLSWNKKSKKEWDLGCVQLGSWTKPHRIPLLPSNRDRTAFEKTPPKLGVVSILQRTSTDVTINLLGFLEEETEVVLTQIWVIEVTPTKPVKPSKLLQTSITPSDGTMCAVPSQTLHRRRRCRHHAPLAPAPLPLHWPT